MPYEFNRCEFQVHREMLFFSLRYNNNLYSMMFTGQFINSLILICKIWTTYSMYSAKSGVLQVKTISLI